MFSKKYQEELFQKKYNSMKQMDRLEFQNNLNIQGQLFMVGACFLSLALGLLFVSFLFFISADASYNNLKDYGFDTSNILPYYLTSGFSVLLFTVATVIYWRRINKNEEEDNIKNEKFLEEHTK